MAVGFLALILFALRNLNKKTGFYLSNGHLPHICQNGKLLVRMCRGESHFSQKSPLANVGKCIESNQNRLANVGECIESGQNRLANVGECIEYLPSLGKCWPMIR
jgi:hypothetical protein